MRTQACSGKGRAIILPWLLCETEVRREKERRKIGLENPMNDKEYQRWQDVIFPEMRDKGDLTKQEKKRLEDILASLETELATLLQRGGLNLTELLTIWKSEKSWTNKELESAIQDFKTKRDSK